MNRSRDAFRLIEEQICYIYNYITFSPILQEQKIGKAGMFRKNRRELPPQAGAFQPRPGKCPLTNSYLYGMIIAEPPLWLKGITFS